MYRLTDACVCALSHVCNLHVHVCTLNTERGEVAQILISFHLNSKPTLVATHLQVFNGVE